MTASEVAEPSSGRVERSLRDWAKRGVIHLLGTDGHRLGGREPRMKAGYEALARWVGRSAADRAGGIWGPAVLQGLPVNVPQPVPKPRNTTRRMRAAVSVLVSSAIKSSESCCATVDPKTAKRAGVKGFPDVTYD